MVPRKLSLKSLACIKVILMIVFNNSCLQKTKTTIQEMSPMVPSTGMFFNSWASWEGDWWRRPGMFEHLRFCFNGFSLQCNTSNLFRCTTFLLVMTTGWS